MPTSERDSASPRLLRLRAQTCSLHQQLSMWLTSDMPTMPLGMLLEVCTFRCCLRSRIHVQLSFTDVRPFTISIVSLFIYSYIAFAGVSFRKQVRTKTTCITIQVVEPSYRGPSHG
ncbi:uncharacterized protein LAESUDRAFT_68101 [Laetiporus sulphureus 93-53]|uniref:Uncharacterized protein n=1 Tax=Laetiporus sulphureus 93-53 TaxID=1314785 RepID=A0A165F5W5_9APHY|nr:uncharacterized protein LAESUDRAFT_68101 [Laetiporus sulphureus 93-53]KZT08451.1 hypothetical protein LAESUDRAFT_68101 [Laetiporus sulphureus 93-53]